MSSALIATLFSLFSHSSVAEKCVAVRFSQAKDSFDRVWGALEIRFGALKAKMCTSLVSVPVPRIG